MKRFLKWAALLLVVAIIGIGVWGYAPDTDPAAMRAKYANAASQFVDLGNGLKVHVRDEGKRDAPVLVLVHGSNSSLHTWEPWVKRLGDRYRIVSLDQIGHGLTGPHPENKYEAAAFVDVLDRTVAKLRVNRFTLAGNSMGGWVAWNYALAHPGKLEALVLVDASGAPDAKATAMPIGFRLAQSPALRPVLQYITPRALVAKSFDQSVSVKSVVTDDAVDRYWELLRYPGNRKATGDRQRAFPKRAPATTAQLQQLTMPVLIQWGSADGLIPVSAADWFERNIKGARKIIYPGIGHIPMEEIPERSADDLAEFLAETVDDDVTGK